jgi:uncharacterized protein (TIGR02996 family)
MNDEAGFIAALIAEPDDRTTLLVYADWLDEQSERNDPRAEGMRLLAEPEPDWERIAELTSSSPMVRAWIVENCCGRGSVVRLTGGPFVGHVGQVVGAHRNTPEKIVVAVRVLFLGGIIDHELDSSMIECASTDPPE